MNRAFAHIQGLWGRYWALPLIPALYTAATFALHGKVGVEYVLASAAILALAYGHRMTKAAVIVLAPFVGLGLATDVMRAVLAATTRPERVLACEMRNAELALFGVAPNTTLADFFTVHHAKIFDLYFALPYGLFMYAAVAYAGYLYAVDRRRMVHFVGALTVGYAILYTLWLILPAAPPWYVRAHGCAIDLGVVPSAAGLLRVDQVLGFSYFQGWNARAATAFGAFPSMHCATPAIGLLTAWRYATWRTWPIHILYSLSMIVASVYFDHHWLIDGLAGWVLAAISVAVADALLRRWERRKAERA